MKLIAGLGAVALLSSAFFAYSNMVSASSVRPVVLVAADAPNSPANAERLELREIVDLTGQTPRLAERALSLSGKRVRITGYVAHLEVQPQNGFFLVPIPVHGDESGSGTGDLPLQSVFVVTRNDRGSF